MSISSVATWLFLAYIEKVISSQLAQNMTTVQWVGSWQVALGILMRSKDYISMSDIISEDMRSMSGASFFFFLFTFFFFFLVLTTVPGKAEQVGARLPFPTLLGVSNYSLCLTLEMFDQLHSCRWAPEASIEAQIRMKCCPHSLTRWEFRDRLWLVKIERDHTQHKSSARNQSCLFLQNHLLKWWVGDSSERRTVCCACKVPQVKRLYAGKAALEGRVNCDGGWCLPALALQRQTVGFLLLAAPPFRPFILFSLGSRSGASLFICTQMLLLSPSAWECNKQEQQ